MLKKIKALIFLFIASMGTLAITGCGSSLTTYFTTDFPAAINQRGQQNKDIALKLRNAGFIDDTLYDNLCKQIDSQVDMITKEAIVTTGDESALKNDAIVRLGSATSHYWIQQPDFVEYQTDDGTTEVTSASGMDLTSKVKNDISNISDASLSYFVAGNFMHGQYLGNGSSNNGADEAGVDKAVSSPINFFAGQEEVIETLNEKFRAEVWVLDATKIQNDSKSMDEIFAAIKVAVESKDISGVSNYFVQLKDENGPVHLMDDTFNLIENSENNTNASINVPGQDLVMTQNLLYGADTSSLTAESKPVLSVKFNEFNYANFEVLCNTIDMNSGAYYFQTLNNTSSSGGETVRAYILTYPVSVIDSFELDGTYAIADFNDDSGMAVSIASGNLISYESNGSGGYTKASHEVETDTGYLTLDFASSKNEVGKSSLVCNGYREYEIELINEQGKTVPKKIVVPRIILRDYLEATWAPGSTAYDENMVVFGRKIRFRTDGSAWITADPLKTKVNGIDVIYNCSTLRYSIKNNDYCALFVDIDGEEVGSLTKLYITDICDIEALTVGDSSSTSTGTWGKYVVKHFAEDGIASSSKECSAEDLNLQPTQDKLAETTDVTSIKVSTPFPGRYIGNVDINNYASQVQRFYCVATIKGMFDSALYSDWVNSSASKESLVWWNEYLAAHNYKYTIDISDVTEYLNDTYRFELSQYGAIILDLETISKIQGIYDKEDDKYKSSMIRTMFIVVGIFLIAYSMILMLCWVIDTNVDIGFSLLNKATFGHWIAIQYDEELPSHNNEEHTYINGRKMFIKCLIIVAVAIVLIRVDASEIMLVLVSTFGKLASWAQDIIQGVTG